MTSDVVDGMLTLSFAKLVIDCVPRSTSKLNLKVTFDVVGKPLADRRASRLSIYFSNDSRFFALTLALNEPAFETGT